MPYTFSYSLLYNIIIYGATSDKNFRKIIKCQREALKITTGNK